MTEELNGIRNERELKQCHKRTRKWYERMCVCSTYNNKTRNIFSKRTKNCTKEKPARRKTYCALLQVIWNVSNMKSKRNKHNKIQMQLRFSLYQLSILVSANSVPMYSSKPYDLLLRSDFYPIIMKIDTVEIKKNWRNFEMTCRFLFNKPEATIFIESSFFLL